MTTAHASVRRLALGLAALGLALAGCGDDASSGDDPPKRTESLPSVREDQTAIRAALLTAEDLGAPWVERKSVNQAKPVGGKGGVRCGNHEAVLEEADARADEIVSLTRGRKPGAAIVTVWVSTLEPGSVASWRTAETRSLAACSRTEKPSLLAKQEPLDGEVSVDGADEVLGSLTSVYADRSQAKLLYVRQVLVARSGRVVTRLEKAFVQPESDPRGTDTTEVEEFLALQLARVNEQFSD